MPYQMVITQANDLSTETIGFGEDKTLAERVFMMTRQDLLLGGHIVIANVNNPNFIEVVQRRGPTMLFVELCYRPPVDMKNILFAIRLAALSVTDGKYLASGSVRGEVVRAEQAQKTAQYLVKEINPKGTVLTHYLPGEREDAVKAFAALVQARASAGDTVRRNPGAVMKYSAMGADGLTSFEFVEAVQK